jgi:hypothetical protein
MKRILFTLALGALISQHAIAWEKEPSEFWGLRLGHSLAEQLPECRKRTAYSYDFDQPQRCYKRIGPSGKFAELEKNPPIGIGTAKVSVYLVDGRIEGFSFDVAHYNWRKLEALLRERFGPPTRTATVALTTRGGARLTGYEMQWNGRRVTMQLSEYGETVNEARLWLETEALREASKAEAETNAKSHAGNL